MKLTALGTCGPFPWQGGACSGYLVEDGETRVLFDCGSGVLARLFELCPLKALDALVLSHLHFDHCGDLGVLRYALEAGFGGEGPLRVIAPAAPKNIRSLLLRAGVFAPEDARDGVEYPIGSLTVRLHAMRHPVETYGADIRDSQGRRLFYTGDTGLFDGLAALAQGADFLLADTCFTDAQAAARPNVHMSVKQACFLAERAGVGSLGCTHHFGGAERTAIPLDFSPATVVKDMGSYWV